MKIDELQEYALNHGFDSVGFEFTNLRGEVKKGRWIDAYFGHFILEGNTGFITTKQWKEVTGDVFEFRILDYSPDINDLITKK